MTPDPQSFCCEQVDQTTPVARQVLREIMIDPHQIQHRVTFLSELKQHENQEMKRTAKRHEDPEDLQ